MSEGITALVVFAFALGGSLTGRRVGRLLPSHHLTDETRNIVSLGTGFIATMAAIVIGLMVSSAKDTFDERREQLDQASIEVMLIDRAMAEYGTEAAPVRTALKSMAQGWLEHIRTTGEEGRSLNPLEKGQPPIEILEKEIHTMVPSTPSQQAIRDKVLDHLDSLVQLRWTLFEEFHEGRVPTAFVFVVAGWLFLIFLSFGLFAPRNSTASAVFLICAASSALAMLLTVELEEPFTGIIRLSHLPLRETVAHLGR